MCVQSSMEKEAVMAEVTSYGAISLRFIPSELVNVSLVLLCLCPLLLQSASSVVKGCNSRSCLPVTFNNHRLLSLFGSAYVPFDVCPTVCLPVRPFVRSLIQCERFGEQRMAGAVQRSLQPHHVLDNR